MQLGIGTYSFGGIASYLGLGPTLLEKFQTIKSLGFDSVELLSLNAGQVFDRERIYEAVWGFDGEGNSDTIMEHIRKIRAKLAVHTLHGYIDTVWGCGYRWNG